MELGILVEKMQGKLLLNDQQLEDIDTRVKELKRNCEEEQSKVSAHCIQVRARLEVAEEALKAKTLKEFSKLEKGLTSAKEALRSESLVLVSQIDKMTKLSGRGEEEVHADVEECLTYVKEIMDSRHNVSRDMPTFHASKTLAKLKSSDLGFLCVAEYLPSQFQLILTSPVSSLVLIGNTNKATCTVTTTEMFTEKIQANIKFSIKNKSSKETVPFCKEECKLAEDRKSFQICFFLQMPGVYVVTVLLYDQHVADSPLTFNVTNQDSGFKQQTLETPVMVQETSIPPTEEEIVNKQEASVGPSEAAVKEETSPAATSTPTPNDSQSLTVAAPLRRPASSYKQKSPPPSLLRTGTPTCNQTSAPLPQGPLSLSHIPPGGKLTGLRMLSIEEGGKPDSLHKPIGMCLLLNGNIVVASTFEDKVKMFSPSGQFIDLVSSSFPFTRPSDMVTLMTGQFVVRDDTRVQVFSQAGNYMRTLWEDKGRDKCYGLAQDKEGRLVTIMETRRPRKTDLLFFDINTGDLARKIEMEDIISDKAASKCRFLTYQLGKLYITDLGLDCVYILDPATINVKMFGSSGSGPGQLSDPAGLVVDTVGNMIVADSRNHRLCVFNVEGKFVCNVTLSPETRRPSGVVVDNEKRELYVLNLQGKLAMTKYQIK